MSLEYAVCVCVCACVASDGRQTTGRRGGGRRRTRKWWGKRSRNGFGWLPPSQNSSSRHRPRKPKKRDQKRDRAEGAGLVTVACGKIPWVMSRMCRIVVGAVDRCWARILSWTRAGSKKGGRRTGRISREILKRRHTKSRCRVIIWREAPGRRVSNKLQQGTVR